VKWLAAFINVKIIIMKKFFSMLFGMFKPKASVTLEMSDNGFYVVKAYGQYLTRTVTASKDEADRYFDEVVEVTKKENQLHHVVIKEAIIS
jgi:hypothetical protein